jgi:hypothetical protein
VPGHNEITKTCSGSVGGKTMFQPSSILRSRLIYAFTSLFLLALMNGCSGDDDDDDNSSRKSRRTRGSTDTSTPEDLARATLDTLINDDRKKFASFMIPDEKELIAFMRDSNPQERIVSRK